MGIDISVGDVLEQRYEIVKFLGEGGFAKVFQARDTVIGRDVAIKFLQVNHMALNDDQIARNIIDRFEREARLAANLSHANVVNIYDIGRVDGDIYQPFIVMEMLAGEDLQAYQDRRGAIEPQMLWRIFIPALDALGQAHEMGIVHKDLKPANLFLNGPGQRHEALKIVDFGIAHIRSPLQDDEGARMTQTGQILGTPQYLPPEYINHQEVSPAMDVYQMTLILVELLVAEPVVESGNSLHCLLIHGDGRLELPEYLLDSPLGPVLRKGLALNPRDRYTNADALADALRAIDPTTIPPTRDSSSPLPKRTLTATPINVAEEKPQPTNSQLMVPLLLFSAITGIACLALVIILGVVLNKGERKAPEDTPSTIELKQSANPKEPTQEAPKDTKPATKQPPNNEETKTKVQPNPTPEPPAAIKKEPAQDRTVKRTTSPTIARKQPPATPKQPTAPVEPKPEAKSVPKSGNLTYKQAVALENEAKRKLAQRDKSGALRDCTRAAKNGARGCYNVIMRSAWDMKQSLSSRERRACKVFAELKVQFPGDKMGIDIQRKFLKCEDHGI